MASAQDEFNELMRNKDRRSAHPADDNDDDARSFLNLSDDEEEDRTPPASTADADEDYDDAPPRASSTQARHTIPTTRYGANTGPKGVISDAQNFRDSRRMHRTSMRGSTATTGPQMQLSGLSLAPAAEKARGHVDEEGEVEEEGEEHEEDDDFMKTWRRTRLREMQSGSGLESKMHVRTRSARLWGGLPTVDGEGYLDAVDRSPAGTAVLVYIFDDAVSQ